MVAKKEPKSKEKNILFAIQVQANVMCAQIV